MATVAVVGDGAVGTAVAVALSSFSSVTLVGPGRIPPQKLRCTVEGAGTFNVVYRGIEVIREADIVVAALKAFDIRSAADFIDRICRGPLICLSNGMGLEEEWGSLGHRVEFAVLTSGFRMSLGHFVTHSPGELHCRENGEAERLFQGTFMRAAPTKRIDEVRWAKWYANSVINPLGALTGRPNNEIRESKLGCMIDPLGKELQSLMPSRYSLSMGRKMLSGLLDSSENHCSMLQDVKAGRKTEIDFLTGYKLSSADNRRPLSLRLVNEIKTLS